MTRVAKNTTDLLRQLRRLMVDAAVVDEPIKAYIVPSGDAHLSEYIAGCDERRAFITGFTGSAGTAVITEGQALLWTDGRYYLQAVEEIDQNWTLMKQGLVDTPSQSEWLSKNLPSGARIGVDPEQPDFAGLSFTTISSSGPNGAIIHYKPSPESDRPLSLNEIYLVDSGGQYLDGTTDVTRTLHFGTPTEHERECFTRVLKGQIALKQAIFPNKVKGNTLDTLARKSLWNVGLDYIHGTGHGIGHYLNVHEGPQGISYRDIPDDPGLQENMFVSNEPGYYEDGKFGIRLENIIRIVRANTKHNFANRGYLTFEDVTFVPIQQKMIVKELLTKDEIDYLNSYHAKTRETVGNYLKTRGDPASKQGLAWLTRETEPLQQ
ncbi:unnamed protein product [Allacma fusca]|uniref:Uncharacterized protein n=1 Tax=Allacma fusca TaxID=39272 RepID=A0A8J2LJD8_9HEXA|nr:unnamed protein product [Allacma fusca]